MKTDNEIMQMILDTKIEMSFKGIQALPIHLIPSMESMVLNLRLLNLQNALERNKK